jgi:hypothetical protein
VFCFAIENAIEKKFFSRIIAFYFCSIERQKSFFDLLIHYVFSTHEYQGQTFQEILATDIVKIKNE